MNLYLTADRIGLQTGGGLVTANEAIALSSLGPCRLICREKLGECADPWGWDEAALALTRDSYSLVHGYAGTFGKSIAQLKYNGAKVVWTIAAHDRKVSREEHEQLEMGFPYPHLVEEPLWQRYIEGYRLADVIVCPSSVAADTVKAYGSEFKEKNIQVIPHGCTLPKEVKPPPKRFTVGYMGSFGADKGVRYLLEAWKDLNYIDAVLVLAGKESTSCWTRLLYEKFGGGNVQFRGWVDNASDFYNSISLYVQPSATEGFGCEVLEAMAHGRAVICSRGAGASDMVGDSTVAACDVEALIEDIDSWKRNGRDSLVAKGEECRSIATRYTWEKIRQRYTDLWQSLFRF